jgi:hypothetical protein
MEGTSASQDAHHPDGAASNGGRPSADRFGVLGSGSWARPGHRSSPGTCGGRSSRSAAGAAGEVAEMFGVRRWPWTPCSRSTRRRRRHGPDHRPLAEAAAGGQASSSRSDDQHPGRYGDGCRRRCRNAAWRSVRSTAIGAPRWHRAAIDAGGSEDPDDPVFGPNANRTSRPHWSQRAQVCSAWTGRPRLDIIRWLTGAEAQLALAQFMSYRHPPTDQADGDDTRSATGHGPDLATCQCRHRPSGRRCGSDRRPGPTASSKPTRTGCASYAAPAGGGRRSSTAAVRSLDAGSIRLQAWPTSWA